MTKIDPKDLKTCHRCQQYRLVYPIVLEVSSKELKEMQVCGQCTHSEEVLLKRVYKNTKGKVGK